MHANPGGLTGVPTGFAQLDALTAGLQPGDLILIAARPSMGKTAVALNIGQFAARACRLRVGFFSLEMSKAALFMRLLSAEAQVDHTGCGRGCWPMRSGRSWQPQ